MGADFWIVLRWWGTLFLVGAVAFPLTKRLFSTWYDQGYFFSKAVGMAVVTWIVFVLGTIKLLPFTNITISFSLFTLFIIGIIFHFKTYNAKREGRFRLKAGMTILFEEAFFFAALLFWSWVKGHEPSIRGLEKFMDFGFMQSILNARYFPPVDMWYAGLPINYYYFGHMVVAVLTKLSGLDLAYTFNLMLASIFALTLTMSFSIGRQIGGKLFGGILTAFLVTMAGNLQTLYAFTRGYTGDNVKPFWELLWNIPPTMGIHELWGKIGEGMNTYWYANATRFIPYTIHEFPSYSFVVSDVHGHVLSIPFVLLAIGLLIHVFSMKYFVYRKNILFIGFYAFLVGVLLMTNALNGPIYFGLFFVLLMLHNLKFLLREKKEWVTIGFTIAAVTFIAGLTSLPFLIHFKSFVTGLAVNCPPSFLANSKIGPIIFEGVEKCQVSPLWMWLLLWEFFMYCGGLLILNTKRTQIEKLLLVFFVFSLGLVIFPEFFYFKDIYPMHFRSNTMFKLGYEAFILFSIVSGYTIVTQLTRNNHTIQRRIFFILLIPLLFLVSIYPIFSVRSYFNALKNYQGLYGFNWMVREYPDDLAGIEWLKSQTSAAVSTLVEADGDSYTDYARFSAFTGIPTIIGWPVHEWLWRGTYDVVAPRREEVRTIYESRDIDETKKILSTYGVRYIIVGKLEREKYKELQEWKFNNLGREVFRSGGTVIYETY